MRTISSGDIKLLNSLAALQLSCGRTSSALSLLQLCQHLHQEEPYTLYLIANAYLRIGDVEKSKLFFDRYELLSLEQLPARSLLLKSLISLGSGDLRSARDVFVKALKKLSFK